MEIKYEQKTIVYGGHQRSYIKIKQFVLQQLPELQQKSWTFTYFDSEGDQVILGDDEEFNNTIDYYDSFQQKLILIIKQMWWKNKKVHSKSKLVKQLLEKQSLNYNQFKVQSFNSSSDSDDEFIHIDFKSGHPYFDDSDDHAKQESIQTAQTKAKLQVSYENGQGCPHQQEAQRRQKEDNNCQSASNNQYLIKYRQTGKEQIQQKVIKVEQY